MKQNWLKASQIFLLLLFIISPFSQNCRAQTPFFVSSTSSDYLRDATINTIFESKLGFIWLGTDQGLFRYDGMEYTPYVFASDTLRFSNEVNVIYETSDQKIWAAFSDGQIYHPQFDGTLIPWTENEHLNIYSPVSSIAEQGEELWISTYGQGLFVHTPDSNYHFTTDDGILGNDIYQMTQDGQGHAFLGTDLGINICFFKDGKFLASSITYEDGLPGYIIRTIEPDGKGGFYVGTYDSGVFYWHPEKEEIKQLFQDWDYGITNAISLFDDRELWIATERKGLIQYSLDKENFQVFTEVDDLSVGRITDLHKDREGNLWAMSSSLKIIKANRHFDFIDANDGEALNNIQALIADYKNKLWIGTQDGLFTLEESPEGQVYQRQLPNISSNILSLYEDPFNNLWIGTFGEGIYVYNQESKEIRQLTPADGLVDGSVLSIDGFDDKIWVGTLAGVTQFSLEKDILEEADIPYNQYDAEDKLNAAFIYKVFVDTKKRIWLGTDGDGVNMIEQEELTYFPGADSINFNSVYSITEDQSGQVWFTTIKEGLFTYDGDQFSKFGIEDGLRNLNISSLITDRQGNILILHPSGIDILDPRTKQIIYYDEAVGINNLEPNLNVVCQDQKGDIWIGGQKQVLKYLSPNEDFAITPLTIIDQINVSGNSVDFTQQDRYAYNQNTFLFKYKGLWYTAPETIQYRYQLEGLDDEWITTRDQEVNYVNLPPGKYTFRLASTANNSFSQEPIISYSFTINTPFWERGWFIILTALLISTGIWFTLRSRERRIMKESRLKREKIESQFEALKSQINPHFLFNSFNTLVAIIEENPDTAVRYVERLSDFYRSILQYRDKTVIPLDEELAVVKNYFFLLKERFGDNLKLHIDTKEQEAFVPPLSLQMLMENAIKHNVVSSQKPLTIHIQQDDRGFLKVSNTKQPKRIRPKSTSFGLSSIVARYALLSTDKVKIDQDGNQFTVRLPLIKSRYKQEVLIDPARLEQIEDELET